jgi:hypothetical protein
MRKSIFTMLVAALSLIGVGTSARAEVIIYQCTMGALTGNLRVDTKTQSSLWVDSTEKQPGRARISNTTIVFTESSRPGYEATIDRRTGAVVDTDGDTGNCILIK